MIELTIKVKDDSQTLRVKHILYCSLTFNPLDPTLEALIREAVDAFQGVKPPESVIITAKIEV